MGIKAWFPYAFKDTRIGGLGVGAADQAFYDLIGNAWFKYTPAFNVGRSLEVTAPAQGQASQSYFQASVLPAGLGVGSLGLTGLVTPTAPANNSVGSP